MTKKLVVLIIFAVAFGFIEAAVVFYLRKMFGYQVSYEGLSNYSAFINLGFIHFISPTQLIFDDRSIYAAEMLREGATIIVLACVAYIAAEKSKQRWGAFLIAFSLWDIFYYIFLRYLIGWPRSLFDKDLFFLVPVPWVGPVIFPLVIFSLLFIVGVKLYLKK